MTVHPSKKHLLVAAAILASGAVIVPMRLASPKAIEAAPPPPTVLVSLPMERRVTGTDTYTGRFDAVDSVEVRPRVSGYIDRVEFRDGDLVTKGQLLFVIPHSYQAELAQAEGHLVDTRSQRRRGGCGNDGHRIDLSQQECERALHVFFPFGRILARSFAPTPGFDTAKRQPLCAQ
jgi:multidrug efflux pump subunit AcrA (membrane-fusion protein)